MESDEVVSVYRGEKFGVTNEIPTLDDVKRLNLLEIYFFRIGENITPLEKLGVATNAKYYYADVAESGVRFYKVRGT